jgi:hypothetical protein
VASTKRKRQASAKPRRPNRRKKAAAKTAAKTKSRATRKVRAKTAPKERVTKLPAKARKTGGARRTRSAALEPEERELLQSLKNNPRHHRLPPDKRHEVPEDEAVEREGVAGRVFVESDTEDEEAQQLGEEFVRSVTSGEEAESEMEEEAQDEEQGGPFIITTAREEYAYDSDESNPPGAEREPFPRVSLPVRPKAD